MRIVIIGGGTAGSETAWRLRKLNKDIEIIILEKGEYTQYSPCSLPYFISHKIKNADDILLFNPEFYKYNKIDLRLNSLVTSIDRQKKEIKYLRNKKTNTLTYDYLVLASGLSPQIPKNLDLSNCNFHLLKTLDDAKKIKKTVKKGEKALIIGAGYIGVELAESLNSLGLKVTLVENQKSIMPTTFDEKMSKQISQVISEAGVNIITEANVSEVSKNKARVNDKIIEFNHLFLTCGLSPNLNLAKAANIKHNSAIYSDKYGKTSDKSIYTLGDAVLSINAIDNKKIFSQLATTAVSQAKIVAYNILNKEKKEIDSVLSSSVSGFNDLIFSSTGVTKGYCKNNNIDCVFAFYKGKDKAEYHPNAKDFFVLLVANLKAEIIGCQVVGYSEVVGRLNMLSLAIKNKIKLNQFIKTETAYNPAYSPIFDPIVLAAEICLKKLKVKNV